MTRSLPSTARVTSLTFALGHVGSLHPSANTLELPASPETQRWRHLRFSLKSDFVVSTQLSDYIETISFARISVALLSCTTYPVASVPARASW